MRKKKADKENSERWLVTYSDLITLLMVLFVILYATSNVDKAKYQQLSASFQQAFSLGSGGDLSIVSEGGGDVTDLEIEEEKEPIEKTKEQIEDEKLEDIQKQVNSLLKSAGLDSNVTTKIEDRGLIISFTENVFFDSGQALIKDEYKYKLVDISKILNKMDNYIRVEGHTDNEAIRNQYFNSNWQLSSVRASNVAEVLIAEGGINPIRLSAVGYGEYRPITSNDTEEGRRQNRRVDIIILNSKYDKSEG